MEQSSAPPAVEMSRALELPSFAPPSPLTPFVPPLAARPKLASPHEIEVRPQLSLQRLRIRPQLTTQHTIVHCPPDCSRPDDLPEYLP